MTMTNDYQLKAEKLKGWAWAYQLMGSNRAEKYAVAASVYERLAFTQYDVTSKHDSVSRFPKAERLGSVRQLVEA